MKTSLDENLDECLSGFKWGFKRESLEIPLFRAFQLRQFKRL